MPTIAARHIIERASEIVQDESNVTWTEPQAISWVNDAQRTISIVKPDEFIVQESLQLAQGTKQTITGHKLLDVMRNMGSDGATPGRNIRLVERGIKDDFNPNWHTDTASATIKEWMYDGRDDKNFYVWPPVPTSPAVYVEIMQETVPADVTDIDDTISIDDIYTPAMIEWVVYRFLSRESEESPDFARAAAHYQRFFDILQLKMQSDLATNPKVREQLN